MLSLFSNRHPLAQLESQRQALLKQNVDQLQSISNALPNLLAKPFPSPKADIGDYAITVLDIETSGLNPSSDSIVSIGWLHIVNGVIKLSSAQHHIIYEEAESVALKSSQAGQQEDKQPEMESLSRSLHHILPEHQQHGITLDQAMNRLFESLTSPIILAHGSTIEKRFFEQYYRTKHCPTLPLIWLDTLKIEQNTTSGNQYNKDFRLFALRNHYQLPDYPAHHALMDAIATAELYLAQKQRLFNLDTAPLGILYQYSL